jgi:hypothetical protein
MKNLPGGPDLLDIARETLVTELPSLSGDSAKYAVAMIANAMAIATREAKAGEGPERAALQRLDVLRGGAPRELHGADLADAVRADERRLAADIRAGRYDANERQVALLDHLRQSVLDRLRISNPKSLES